MRIDPRIRTAILRWLEHPAPPPDGPPPTVDELIALSDGHLESERRRQVLAHLARDGELTRTWVQAQRAGEQILTPAPPPPPRRTSWHRLGPLAGLAAAAVLAGVLIWPVPRDTVDPTAALDALVWPEDLPLFRWPLGAKRTAPPEHAVTPDQRAAFAAGVATALRQAPDDPGWERLRRYYGARGAGVACPEEPCSAAQRSAWQAGRWAAWTRGVCLSAAPPAPETVRALRAARATDEPAADLAALCAEAEQWFRRYE